MRYLLRHVTCSGVLCHAANWRKPHAAAFNHWPLTKARQGHVRSRRKPTLVGLKENQRINPLQSKLTPVPGRFKAFGKAFSMDR